MKNIETLSYQELLTINEAAVLVGIGKGSLRKAVSEPSCQYCMQLGNRNLIIRSELREKEKDIIDQVNRGMDYKKGRFTFESLVEKYLQYNKRTIREQTDDWYKNLLKKRINDEIFSKPIGEIKTSDMKDYFIQLDESKYAYETLTKLHSLFKRAFNMAVEDDAIVKNPCEFVLSECIVKKPKKEKFSLTFEQ